MEKHFVDGAAEIRVWKNGEVRLWVLPEIFNTIPAVAETGDLLGSTWKRYGDVTFFLATGVIEEDLRKYEKEAIHYG